MDVGRGCRGRRQSGTDRERRHRLAVYGGVGRGADCRAERLSSSNPNCARRVGHAVPVRVQQQFGLQSMVAFTKPFRELCAA